jgi:CHASE3 domain sensor protein
MLAGFLIGLLVLIGAALLLARSVATLQDARVLAKHARSELETLVSFLATIEDAETGQRGYLLTGDSTYLAPYTEARHLIGDQVAQLDSLTAADPSEHAAVVALRGHVAVKMGELAESIRLRARAPDAASALMLTGAGQREMMAIRTLVEGIRQVERRRLDEHLQAFTSGVAALVVHLAVAIGLQFALLAILFLLTRRDQAFRAAATASLTHEREFLRALLESLSEGVAATDNSGRPTMINRALRELFGVDVLPATDAGWADVRSRVRDAEELGTALPMSSLPLQRAVRGERVEGMAFAFVPPGTAPGEAPLSGARYLVANGQPIRDAAGQQVGAVVAFRDVTQEFVASAALQASEERFRRLSDAATDGVIVSRDGSILEVNAAWCRMCGADESTLIGTPIIEMVSPDDREAVARIIRENRRVTYSVTAGQPAQERIRLHRVARAADAADVDPRRPQARRQRRRGRVANAGGAADDHRADELRAVGAPYK